MSNSSSTTQNVTTSMADCWIYHQFAGLFVNQNHGPLRTSYLDSIHQTIDLALADSPRTFAVRFDLHLPVDFDVNDTGVIGRFFASLKAQLDAADLQKLNEGKRVHPHNLRYIWVREIGSTGRPHYHVLLLLNHDRYRTLGSFENDEGNMSARIKKAWASALAYPLEQVARLVHFPEHPEYRLDTKSEYFKEQLQALFYRVSYFAKLKTKVIGPKQRSFGTSRN